MEAKLALTEVALESGDKLAAKDATEHPDGKEEGIARLDPAGTVEGESAGGHHTMDMGVMFELLIPSVEHAKEADLGTEMFGIASDFEKGFGTGLQQEMVEDLLVLQSQRRQFMRQGEDKMDVTRGEKFLTTRLQPTLAGVGLTLRAVPIAATVVGDGRTVPAVGALKEMPTQGGGAAARDGSQHFDVLPGDPLAASFDECLSRGANQIGHLQWRPVHLLSLQSMVV